MEPAVRIRDLKDNVFDSHEHIRQKELGWVKLSPYANNVSGDNGTASR